MRGKDCTVDEAETLATELIGDAVQPTLFGLTGLSVEAIEAAVELAQEVSALVIPHPSDASRTRAGVDVPESSASRAEILADADVVLFWTRDLAPYESLVQSVVRRSLRGVDGTAKKRRVLAIGIQDSGYVETLKLKDRPHAFLQAAQGLSLHAQSRPGAEDDAVPVELLTTFDAGRYVHVYVDPHLDEAPEVDRVLQSLAAQIRPSKRMTVAPLPIGGNARGVTEVLSWTLGRTGALEVRNDAAVDASWRSGEVLPDGRCTDLVIAAGLPTGVSFESHAPRIAIGTHPDRDATVSFITPGLDPRLSATVVRDDGVFLSLDGRSGSGLADPTVRVLQKLTRAAASMAGERDAG